MPGASMNKETWGSLSPEGQATWDALGDGDKKKILQYAHKRAAQGTRDANQHVTEAHTDAEEIMEESEVQTIAQEEDSDMIHNSKRRSTTRWPRHGRRHTRVIHADCLAGRRRKRGNQPKSRWYSGMTMTTNSHTTTSVTLTNLSKGIGNPIQIAIRIFIRAIGLYLGPIQPSSS